MTEERPPENDATVSNANVEQLEPNSSRCSTPSGAQERAELQPVLTEQKQESSRAAEMNGLAESNDQGSSASVAGCTFCSNECWKKPFTKKFWLSASSPEIDWKFWALLYAGIIVKLVLMGLNIVDLVADASIKDWHHFSLLLATMLLPLIPINLFSYWWYKTDGRPSVVPWNVCIIHWCLLGYWWRQLRLIRQALSVTASNAADLRHRFSLSRADITFLSLVAVYSSSAPQLVFKLYRLIERWDQHAATNYTLPLVQLDTGVPVVYPKMVFAAFSGLSLALATIAHSHASRQHRWDKLELSMASRCLQVLYRVFCLGSRVVVLACLFKLSTPAAWGICIGLCLLMLVWFRWMHTEFCEFAWQEWIYNMLLCYMHLFGVFNVKDTPARYRYLLYYTFSLLLEVTVLVCAALSGAASPWVLMAVLPFMLGVVLHAVEHAFFHAPAVGAPPGRLYIPRTREPWEDECQQCSRDRLLAAPDPDKDGAQAA